MIKNCPLCGSEHLDEVDVCECGYRFSSVRVGDMPEVSAPSPDQSNLTIPGWIMSAAGVALAIYAFAIFDPSVDGYVSGDYASLGSRINNTGLLQRQLMLFIAGCSMLISGVVMLAAGAQLNARKCN